MSFWPCTCWLKTPPIYKQRFPSTPVFLLSSMTELSLQLRLFNLNSTSTTRHFSNNLLIDNMNFLNYILALLGLLMVTAPVCAKPDKPCCLSGCSPFDEGKVKCADPGKSPLKMFCHNGCGHVDYQNWCKSKEVCVEIPSVHCQSKYLYIPLL